MQRIAVGRSNRGRKAVLLLLALLMIAGATAPLLETLAAEFVLFVLLPLAVIVPIGIARALGRRPARLPGNRTGEPAVDPEALRDPELRHAFHRMLEYRQGMVETAAESGDTELGRTIYGILQASDGAMRRLFRLATAVEDRRQNRLLGNDLERLRSRPASLTPVEKAQLASLERTDHVARRARQMFGDAQAIIGRCYAQSREIALVSGLAEGEPEDLLAQLGEQASMLDQLTKAVHEVYQLK